MRVIDLRHQGRERVIAAWEHDGFLVDPGPESTVATLLDGLGEGFEPRAILLTHIHFDHAGGTGRLVERWPDVPVYVHEIGAPHMVDPARLVKSARRLYGDAFDRLWGEVVPVPKANVTSLTGGETLLDGGYRVEYTPGHASHHVCYLHEETGTAFVGDVAACRLPGTDLVIPPTPPPDIDVELWEESIGIVEAWTPEKLALTHFGPIDDPASHLAEARRRLREEAELARGMDEATYESDLQRRIGERLDPETRDEMFQAVPTAYQWAGLDRYWRKRAA